MITKKTHYGLKAMMYLAKRPGEPVLISDISTHEHIPKKFLEAILLELKRHHLVDSKKGKGGGYVLSQNTLPLGQIIRALEGPLAPLPCASVTAYKACKECVDVSTCGLRLVMREVRDAMSDILDHITLEDVQKKVDAAIQSSCTGHQYCI